MTFSELTYLSFWLGTVAVPPITPRSLPKVGTRLVSRLRSPLLMSALAASSITRRRPSTRSSALSTARSRMLSLHKLEGCWGSVSNNPNNSGIWLDGLTQAHIIFFGFTSVFWFVQLEFAGLSRHYTPIHKLSLLFRYFAISTLHVAYLSTIISSD